MKIQLYIGILLLLFSKFGNAQDMHWSLTNENALYQNPANTGNIEEDFRITASTRDQWRSVTKPYQTQLLTFDLINKYNRKLGYGGSIIHDVTGDGIFRTIEGKINASYLFKESKKKAYNIRAGMDIGYKNNQMNFSNYMFDNQYDGFIYSNYIPSNEKFITQQKSNLTIGIGCLFSKIITKNIMLTIGSSIFNLNQPNQGFYGLIVPRFRRYNYSMQVKWIINNSITLYPSINFTHQFPYKELLIGTKCNLNLLQNIINKELLLGLYFRNKDAILLQLGIHLNKFVASINYDVNTSQLTKASNGRGAIELNIQYLWSRKKNNNLMHKKCLDYL